MCKGKTSFKPSFLDSILNFGGVVDLPPSKDKEDGFAGHRVRGLNLGYSAFFFPTVPVVGASYTS